MPVFPFFLFLYWPDNTYIGSLYSVMVKIVGFDLTRHEPILILHGGYMSLYI